jgi:selenocysteine lyase/cysteine desulfurase
LQDLLHYEYHIEVPVKCVQGGLYVRISAHVYNELADYEKLASAVGELIKTCSSRSEEEEQQ